MLNDLRTLKIRFNDGSFQIIKNCIEYTSGLDHFFVVVYNSQDEKTYTFKRDKIESVERKTQKGYYLPICLKQRRNYGSDQSSNES